MTMQQITRVIPGAIFLALLGFIILILIFIPSGLGEGGAACNESGDHEVANWIRVYATPADPMPEDIFEVIASVEIFENGSWQKEWNTSLGELVWKPGSPGMKVIDRQSGTMEGVILRTDNDGQYRVWAGICRDNQSYWNFTTVVIEKRNSAPFPIALIGTENGTVWSTELEVRIIPGDEFTVFLNGSLSSDPDGDALDLYWDIDGISPTNDILGVWGNWTYFSAGTYSITLTVEDGNLTRETTILLHIHYDIFPDLVATTPPFLSMKSFTSGELVNVTSRIQNQGEAASGPFSIYVYDHDLLNEKIRTIYIQEVGQLGVNEFYTLSFNWTLTNLAYPGTHVIRVMADALQEVSEENETNNIVWGNPFKVSSAVVDLPFVTVSGISISNETPYLFELVNISLTIQNSGSGDAELLTVFLLVNGEEYDIRYVPLLEAESDEVMILRYYADLKGSYNLTCQVYDNGFLQGSAGRRIMIKDLPRPPITSVNDTDPNDDSSDYDWLLLGAGVFMIVMAIVIQVVERKARDK